MNRYLSVFLVAIGSVAIIVGCSGKKGDEHQHRSEQAGEWTAMDEFHMVMAESFHPYKDSANLEPAKQNADSLVVYATRWAEAPLPEKFENDDEIRFKLDQLKTDASTFASTVETNDDKAIGESLTKLHNLFHGIQDAWYHSDGHDRHR